MGAKPLRILVVDDHHLILKLVGMILEGAGHVPVGVESGPLALAEAHRDPPDLVVVDEIMEGMSGSDVIRALRASSDTRLGGIPIIGISGRLPSREPLLAAGADVFLPKPLDEHALVQAVATLTTARAPRPGSSAA